jgi:hypothetical protein
MNDSKLTTADFLAGGRRDEDKSVTTQQESGMETRGVGGAAMAQEPGATPLFAADEAERFRTRWNEIQTSFVDEPRRCVEQADNLVAEAMKRLAEGFASQRSELEHQWDRGSDVSTEDLRQTLRRYRSFFDRLLRV